MSDLRLRVMLGHLPDAHTPADLIALRARLLPTEATAPTGTGKFVRVVGYAITAEPNTIFFNPSNTDIELA
jgi:hypothetical protein